jgi:beta-hydroxylase
VSLSIMSRVRRAGVKIVEALVTQTSSVGRGPFFEAKLFPWAASLEASWTAVRAELDALLADKMSIPLIQQLSPEQSHIAHGDTWRSFYLFAYGRVEENCRLCPTTAALLENVPGVTSAFFSILAPGTHIPAHRGPYAGVLRLHLGLRIPGAAGAARIRVGGETRHWLEGKCLFFDDTFTHEVWNESAEDRVVLFVDFERPVRFPASFLNRRLLRLLARTPMAREGRENLKVWNQRRDLLARAGGEAAGFTAMSRRRT